MKTTRIVAAVVDTHNLTLYKEDGTTVLLPQGDPRIRKIVEVATPMLLSKGYADVDLSAENPYQKFEEQSSGGIRFFKVAKDKLKKFFGFGANDPVIEKTEEDPKPEETKLEQTKAAVEEILQHAVPVSAPEFHEETVHKQNTIVDENGKTPNQDKEQSASETIVAVVDNKIIPGVEKIKTQVTHAAKHSTVGMENFLKRLGTVIEKRSHSVEDLLRFLERGDLPIADDGSILIYKVLRRKGLPSIGKYVDCHTNKVEQWVGAYVCMDEKLVDPNRRNECSNGLHVARRGYVGGFSGDVCVIAKLAPEDVIAVPDYDANKMRVCGYHILMELTDKQFSLLKSNKPLTDDPEGKTLLANAMSGNHVGKTHEVRITRSMGGDVVVTPLVNVEEPKPILVVAEEPKKVETLDTVEQGIKDEPVNPKDVVAKVEQLSKKQQAQKLYDEGKHTELFALKKAAKVSWTKLGLPQMEGKVEVAKPVEVAPRGKLTKVATPKPKPVPKAKPKTLKEAVKKEDTKRTVNGVVLGEGSVKERIQKLLAIGLTSVGVAQAILNLKKQAKQSWDKLGVTPEDALKITELASK